MSDPKQPFGGFAGSALHVTCSVKVIGAPCDPRACAGNAAVSGVTFGIAAAGAAQTSDATIAMAGVPRRMGFKYGPCTRL